MDLVEMQKCFSAFQLSYQNKSCSECQQDVIKSVRQTDKQEDIQRARQTEKNINIKFVMASRNVYWPSFCLVNVVLARHD